MVCSFFIANQVFSQTTLVSTNAEYQYYDNGDQPANDAADNPWYSAEYTASWSSFNGPLGYGVGDHNEVLNPSANTVYFRHQWNIESTSDFDLMFLNLLYNDGAIIYLNGNVINRVNMPVGDADYNTQALTNVGEQQVRNIALPHLFIDGINTVAIEVHNAGDSNLSFGLEVIEYHEICELLGIPCNDLDANTINDVYNEDCECEGFDCDITADAGPTQEINEGQAVTLEAQGGEAFFWSTGDTLSSITVSPTSTTGYSVTVTDEFGCEDFADVMVNVIPCNASVDLGEDVEIESTGVATLTSTPAEAYAWSTGDTTQSISVSPDETETYAVTITDKYGCHATDEVAVSVNQCLFYTPCDDGNAFTYDDYVNDACVCEGTPCDIVAAISGPDSMTAGETVTLVATGGISYTWNNGMSTAAITVSPSEATNYNVVIVDEHGCGDVASHFVAVDVPGCFAGTPCNDDSDGTYGDQLNESCECIGFPCHMDVEIDGTALIGPGQIATITAEGGINYIWDHGAVGPVIQVSPAETMTYNVNIIDQNGCEEFTSFTVEVSACIVGESCNDNNDSTYQDQLNSDCECVGFPCHMDVEVEGTSSIVQGETAFINAEGGIDYAWDNGMSGPSISVTPATTTTYNVVITDSNGCVEEASFLVTVNDVACTPYTECDDFDIGTYLDQYDSNCECIGIPCNLNVQIQGDSIISQGESATITASGGDLYTWNNGMRGSSITVSPNTTIEYSVIITDLYGCEDFRAFTVIVESCQIGSPCDDGVASTYGETINEVCDCVGFDCSMDIEIEGDNTILEGETATINAEGGVIYEWNNGMTTPTIEVSPTQTTNYSVIITDSNGCVDVASFVVEVFQYVCTPFTGCDDFNPDTYQDEYNQDCNCVGIPCDINGSVSGDTEIEMGQTASLTAMGGSSYSWSNGAKSSTIEVSPFETTTYSVVISDINGCVDEAEITVVVGECNVEPDVPNFYSMFIGDEQVLTAAGGEYYEWSTGETTANITIIPSESTTYEVSVFNSETCFEVVEVFVEAIEDLCRVGDPCDDFDSSTINDLINEDCECVGELAQGEDNGAGSVAGGTSTTSNGSTQSSSEEDNRTKEIEEEDCTPITSFFSRSKLKHYGEGATVTQYQFATLQSDVSFTISGITAKLTSTDKKNYIDVVNVSYINESGQEISYGTFSGESVREVEVNISENIQEIIISLTDVFDGDAPKINVSLGNISSCSINRQGATAQNNGLQSAQQELIEVSLQSNLVNGRLMLNINNPNSSSQPIYAVVIDANGQPVIPDAVSGELLPGSQSEYIDITSLRPGLYYLKTQVGRQTVTLKFVVAE